MIDKKVLKFYLIGLIISATAVIVPMINNFSDDYMKFKLYTLPFGETSATQAAFFYLLALFAPFLAIFIGYGLAYVVILVYCRFTKFSKRIEFVGYANIDRSGKYLKRRYLIQLLFGTLLCANIWIIIMTDPDLLSYWLSDLGKSLMYDSDTGRIFNFPMISWYWVPIFITTLVFAMCAVIQDSGIVSVKKLSGQSDFSDTERVGDKMFGIVKGYAGIAVIFSFISLLQSPMGQEGSLVLYPLLAALMILHFIIAIDLFRGVGRKWIFKAVKRYYDPQMIKLSFEKSDIADFNDLVNK